jgi:hypothetical protein
MQTKTGKWGMDRTHFGSTEGFSFANYEFVQFFDMRKIYYEDADGLTWMHIDPPEVEIKDNVENRCHHCNKYIVKGSVWYHKPSGKNIVVGGDCHERFVTELGSIDEWKRYAKDMQRKYLSHIDRTRSSMKEFKDILLKIYRTLHDHCNYVVEKHGSYEEAQFVDGESKMIVNTHASCFYKNFIKGLITDCIMRGYKPSRKQLAIVYSYNQEDEFIKIEQDYVKAKAKAKAKEDAQKRMDEAPELTEGRQEVEGVIMTNYMKDGWYGCEKVVKIQNADGNFIWFNAGIAFAEEAEKQVDWYEFRGKTIRVKTTIKLNKHDARKGYGKRTAFIAWK